MAIDAQFIQIKVFGELQGQEVLNVFHYQLFLDANPSVALSDVAVSWGVFFDQFVMSLLSTTFTTSRVVIDNLSAPLEFYEGTFVATGDATGDCMPAHDTFSVKLIRQSKLTRNGRKSFSGVSENTANNGVITLPAQTVTELENFCGQPLEFLNPENGDAPYFLNPVIIGRTLNAQGIYELDLNRVNLVVGAQLNPRVRTQNTRKA